MHSLSLIRYIYFYVVSLGLQIPNMYNKIFGADSVAYYISVKCSNPNV